VRRPRRKAEETREDILQAAETLFRERGIAGCSIADIAQALSMSPANIFKHFHSKPALVDAICERHIRHLVDRLATLDEQAPAPIRMARVACNIMEAHLQDIRENPHLFEMILMVSKAKLPSALVYRRKIEDLFADLIAQGMAAGTYHCKDANAASQRASAAFASILHPVLLANADLAELHDRCDGLAELVNAALQNPFAK